MDTAAALDEIMSGLRARADPVAVAGMARFGICGVNALGGTPTPQVRALARLVGRDHALAAALWATGVHEAQVLATMVDDPSEVSEGQMEAWAYDFRSWDLCDQACYNLFWRTAFAWAKAAEWAAREGEFVKRAGFALMAALAVHDKKAGDGPFLDLLPLIEREAGDERTYVRKAVNWALRQIGKRNANLNRAAVESAERIARQGSRPARWIAADALRELRSEAVQARLAARGERGGAAGK